MLTLHINGVPHTLPLEDNASLFDLTTHLNITPEHIIIEQNAILYKHDQFKQIPIKEADQIEIIHFIGGG
jgi:sulfur carrier protein